MPSTEDTEYAVAQMHAEAGQRQAALSLAIGSLSQNDPPAGTKTIRERAEEFYGFLAVTPSAD